MIGVNAASCSSARGHVIELGAAIGDDARELPVGNPMGGCRSALLRAGASGKPANKARGIAGKEGQFLHAESVMPQRDPIDDVKGDVIEIDL
jgi:hypothetical protein